MILPKEIEVLHKHDRAIISYHVSYFRIRRKRGMVSRFVINRKKISTHQIF